MGHRWPVLLIEKPISASEDREMEIANHKAASS